MSRLILLLTMLWFPAAYAQFDIIQIIQNAATKEFAAILEPLAKGAVYVGFGQCALVRKLVGVHDDNYIGKEPDLSKLTITVICRSAPTTYKLSEAHIELPKSEKIDFTRPLKIYLHGFTDDPTKGSFANISNAFLLHDDINIVALDSSSMIHSLYLRSTSMVSFIGRALGTMLAACLEKGLEPHNIHLIGHSIGAHIAGFAGKTYKSLTGYKVGRISGLDPAGPCFADLNATLRLSQDDANFVDVIHTDAGVFGLDQQIGHVDFYPNSGSLQPDCLFQVCSHVRVLLLFAESIVNPDSFVGVKCKDWKSFKKGDCEFTKTSVMGFGCSNLTRGVYYLQTNDHNPYAREVSGLKFDNNIGVLRNLGSIVGLLQTLLGQ